MSRTARKQKQLMRTKKMSEKMILASNNKGKIKEIKEILKPWGYDVISMSEAGIDAEIEESGSSFKENAYIKAKYIYDKTGCCSIADDSGLEVAYLKGAPGVHSHRYAGENATDEDRCRKLLGELEGVPENERKARFCCVICYFDETGTVRYAKGECNGHIGFEPVGDNGFGYDPVFMVGDKSMAQLTAEEKNSISHRGNALKELVRIMEKVKAE